METGSKEREEAPSRILEILGLLLFPLLALAQSVHPPPGFQFFLQENEEVGPPNIFHKGGRLQAFHTC